MPRGRLVNRAILGEIGKAERSAAKRTLPAKTLICGQQLVLFRPRQRPAFVPLIRRNLLLAMNAPSLSTSPERRPPLGLPNGSVRALLTLLIVAVVFVQVARGHQIEALWTETLMIALAHYFTSRRF